MINLRDKGAETWGKWGRPQRVTFAVIVIAIVGLLPYGADFSLTSFLNTPVSSYQAVLVYPVGMFVLMALGLNIVVGKSGLLDLGYVAFFAIGGYTAGLLGIYTKLNTWEILPIGMAAAMVAGVALGLPTLRLRGDYLAIVTLGFGEIVRIVALNSQSLGASTGIAGIPTPPKTFGLTFDIEHSNSYFWVVLIMILLVIWMVRRLTVRRAGRAWEAIRQDEDVAILMGVPILKYKIWSFCIGAAIGGAAGVIFASKTQYVAPNEFTFNVSVLILSCVVFGGMGNIWGVVMGGVLLAYLPERIRFISNARQLVFGLTLVIIMNLRPDGLLPRKKREKLGAKAMPEKEANDV
jgi:branched-chain amino acid transport system permease protein